MRVEYDLNEHVMYYYAMSFSSTISDDTKTNIIVRDKKTKQPTKELNSEQFATLVL